MTEWGNYTHGWLQHPAAKETKWLEARVDSAGQLRNKTVEARPENGGHAQKQYMSPKKITLLEDTEEHPDLAHIPFITNFQKVAVHTKVLKFAETMTVTGGKKKQEVTIGDHTSTARVTLCEQHIGSLKDGSSYNLKNFVVREYASIKYLSMPREGWEILPIDDIGDFEH